MKDGPNQLILNYRYWDTPTSDFSQNLFAGASKIDSENNPSFTAVGLDVRYGYFGAKNGSERNERRDDNEF